jgi:hypothetical protein
VPSSSRPPLTCHSSSAQWGRSGQSTRRSLCASSLRSLFDTAGGWYRAGGAVADRPASQSKFLTLTKYESGGDRQALREQVQDVFDDRSSIKRRADPRARNCPSSGVLFYYNDNIFVNNWQMLQ